MYKPFEEFFKGHIPVSLFDENYTEKEKSLIMNFIEVSSKKELDKIFESIKLIRR